MFYATHEFSPVISLRQANKEMGVCLKTNTMCLCDHSIDSRSQSLVRVACRERELEEVVVVKVGGYLSKRALSFRTLFEMFKSYSRFVY